VLGGRGRGRHAQGLPRRDDRAGRGDRPAGQPQEPGRGRSLARARQAAGDGIDSPCRAAEPGERSRCCERELSGSVCAIRYTPGESVIFAGGSYYEWIRNGLELYAALAGDARTARAEVVEVFPTAAWTRWHGARGSRTRARWSSQALALLKLEGLPARRLSQDERDAVVAALTARLFGEGRVEAFGEIIVPAGRPS
jgi:predicted nuclease with RNAse H fold